MPERIKAFLKRVALGVFIACLLGCAATPAPIFKRSGDADLAELLESIRIKEKLPAIAAAIIINGKIHATAAVGARKAGTTNWVTVSDRFLIASCAKAFTATLSAILIGKGHFGWDTTLRDAFPHIIMPEEYEEITLIQLLSHRAGLPEWIDHIGNWWSDRGSPETMRKSYLKETLKQKLSDRPGKTVFYSNSGYIIAGAVMEQLMGKPYEELITEVLFEPLSMNTAGFGPPAKMRTGRQPFGHYGIFRSPISSDFPEYMSPTAAIHLSIEDWSRFILLHLGIDDESKLQLEEEALHTLHTQPDSAPWRKGSPERGYGISSINYALGWYTLNIEEKKGLLWHPGGNTGFIAQVLVDLQSKNAIMLVTNVRTSHKHLFRAMDGIKNHYASIADLPVIK